MKRFILSLIAIVVLTLSLGVGFVYSGIFDVAATSKDSALLSWVLMTTREHSIESRASAVMMPEEEFLNKQETLLEGFEHYNEMCVVCHGAPGVDAGEARKGLNPEPPLLAKLDDIKDDPLTEIFWIIKNGIKMTAMPAWGPTHNDDKVWAMAVFVKKLPEMSAEDYQALRQQVALAGGGHSHEHGHDHETVSKEPHDSLDSVKHTHDTTKHTHDSVKHTH